MTTYKTRYGQVPIGRVDIRGQRCISIDMRGQTGHCADTGACGYDETKIVEPGTFTLSVFAPAEGELPVGEIRLIHDGVEVSMVGAITDRDVLEITPDHIAAASADDNYRKTMLIWMRPKGSA